MNVRYAILLASLLGASAVLIDSYHAHGLRQLLENRQLDAPRVSSLMNDVATASRYQMYHALAILALCGLSRGISVRWINVAIALFGIGVCCFSGGIYLHVFADIRAHAHIIPFGGILLIGAWFLLAIGTRCWPLSATGRE